MRRALLLPVLLLAGAPALAEDAPTAADGIYSEAQAARGLAVYDAHCMVCHASGMTGGPGSPSLVGRAFLIGWRSETVGALYEQLRATMPTGQAGSLSNQQYADVLAAMLKVNGFPPSADGAELPANASALDAVILGAPE